MTSAPKTEEMSPLPDIHNCFDKKFFNRILPWLPLKMIADLLRQFEPWRSGRRFSLTQLFDLTQLSMDDGCVIGRQITNFSERKSFLKGNDILTGQEISQLVIGKYLEEPKKFDGVNQALCLDLFTSPVDDMLTRVKGLRFFVILSLES